MKRIRRSTECHNDDPILQVCHEAWMQTDWSLNELARRSGYSAGTLCHWFSMSNRRPSIMALYDLCEVLGLRIRVEPAEAIAKEMRR